MVLAERKSPEQTIAIAMRVLDELGRVLLSRVPPEALPASGGTRSNETLDTRDACRDRAHRGRERVQSRA